MRGRCRVPRWWASVHSSPDLQHWEKCWRWAGLLQGRPERLHAPSVNVSGCATVCSCAGLHLQMLPGMSPVCDAYRAPVGGGRASLLSMRERFSTTCTLRRLTFLANDSADGLLSNSCGRFDDSRRRLHIRIDVVLQSTGGECSVLTWSTVPHCMRHIE